MIIWFIIYFVDYSFTAALGGDKIVGNVPADSLIRAISWKLFFGRLPGCTTKDLSYPFHRIFAAFKSTKLHVVLAFFCFSFLVFFLWDNRCVFLLQMQPEQARRSRMKAHSRRHDKRTRGNKFSSSQNTDSGVFIKSLYIFYLLG